jgi:nucleoside-diphosphate-sugar epimerase
LITGASGFLGSNLAAFMADAGWDVRLLDVNRPTPPLDPRHEFVLADIRDRAAMAAAVSGCDVVVDNAALVPVTQSSLAEFRSVNVEGCRTTLQAARAAGAYVVHVSSSSIYGLPRSMPVTPTTPLAPFEPYGRSKAEAEAVVQAARADGQRISSFRARALLGRGRLGLFEIVFNRVRTGRRVPMFGLGQNRVQTCDSRDFGAAVLAAIQRQADGDYNIGAAVFGTVREDMEELIRRVGSTSTLMPVPIWAIRAVLQPLALVGRSPFTAWHWHASGADFWCELDTARRELGWEPQHSNVDALVGAYAHYISGSVLDSPHARPLRGTLARLLRGGGPSGGGGPSAGGRRTR